MGKLGRRHPRNKQTHKQINEWRTPQRFPFAHGKLPGGLPALRGRPDPTRRQTAGLLPERGPKSLRRRISSALSDRCAREGERREGIAFAEQRRPTFRDDARWDFSFLPNSPRLQQMRANDDWGANSHSIVYDDFFLLSLLCLEGSSSNATKII